VNRSLSLVLPALLIAGCFKNPVTDRRQARLISEKAEREIGRRTKQELAVQYGEVKDPVLTGYVAALGRQLASVSDRPRLEYEFTVLDSDVVNAFAAPGGYIFVTRGLLERVEGESELASVLGHEIGHVAALHSVAMIQRQMGAGILTTLGAIASGISLGPEAMIAVAQTASLFGDLYLLGYSRENELEADRVGLRYALSAGYDPHGALTFFEKLRVLEGQADQEAWEPYLRSHPPTEQRVALGQRFIDEMSGYSRPPLKGMGRFKEIKERLPRLPPEDRGRAEGRRFSLPGQGLSVEIPDGWSWEIHNQQVLASFLSPQGGGWGEIRRRRLESPLSLEDFARRTAQERRWQFLSGREMLYPAGYAYVGRFIGSGTLGGGYLLRAMFILRGSVGYVLVCAVPPDREPEFLLPFEGIMRSFKVS
jgi:predicted Zn-dependent protease